MTNRRIIRAGDPELAKLLLSRGADVGAANPRGTPLHLAAARAHPAVVSVLLDHGADVCIGRSCLYFLGFVGWLFLACDDNAVA